MAEIFVNGERVEVEGENLGDLLSSLRREALQKGKVITRVLIEGEAVAVERDEDFAHFLLSDLGKVEIFIEDVREVTLRGLRELYTRRAMIKEKGEILASAYRMCDLEQAHRTLPAILDDLNFFVTLVSSYEIFFGKMGEEKREKWAALKAHISNFHESLLAQNWIESADLVEYEILPLCFYFFDEVPAWLKRAESCFC